MALVDKWGPSLQLERFRREVDDILQRFGLEHHWQRDAGPVSLRPAIEAFVEDDQLTVCVDLPGFYPASIDVTARGGLLTIKGSRQARREARNIRYYSRETQYGSFERTLQLPDDVKPEDLKASYKNGVLELSARLSIGAASKQVEVTIERVEDDTSGRK